MESLSMSLAPASKATAAVSTLRRRSPSPTSRTLAAASKRSSSRAEKSPSGPTSSVPSRITPAPLSLKPLPTDSSGGPVWCAASTTLPALALERRSSRVTAGFMRRKCGRRDCLEAATASRFHRSSLPEVASAAAPWPPILLEWSVRMGWKLHAPSSVAFSTSQSPRLPFNDPLATHKFHLTPSKSTRRLSPRTDKVTLPPRPLPPRAPPTERMVHRDTFPLPSQSSSSLLSLSRSTFVACVASFPSR
mmetsp:Transcript_7632/g.19585  ORF Transcript_7632/g.19585 Transcript_7632/m.19585 type:complete len:248 (+) Transcript_7632:2-745(+)